MHATDMKELAEALLSVTLTAARVQMAHFAAGVTVETKADHSPVTVADRESEDIILAGLGACGARRSGRFRGSRVGRAYSKHR